MGKLVNREQITITLDKKLVKLMRELSKTTRINLSRLMDEAIEDLLKKHN